MPQKPMSNLLRLGIRVFGLFLGVALIFYFFRQPADIEPVEFGLVAEVTDKWTGDYQQMVERRTIRALVVHNPMFYFLDKGAQRGISAELLEEFERYINKRENTGTLKFNVLIIPVTRDQLIPALLDGYGDIALANLTITPQRERLVAFSDPSLTDVEEWLVAGADATPLTSLDDLSGKEIHLRKSSSYFESLDNLNQTLEQKGLEGATIVAADESMEDVDLLEMVNAGLISYTIVDSHKVQFWRQIFDHIVVHEDLKVREGGSIGWAFRKNSPQLAEVVNGFIGESKKGTVLGNILFDRYLKDNQWAKNALAESELEKFKVTVNLFRKYGEQYDFPWLMLGALAYQESELDQSARSAAGAVGIMQVQPKTAADPNINIQNIEKLENNIHAGAKYLRFLMDRYFSGDAVDLKNQMLLTFAAYNAGPRKVSELRNEAQQMGLNPNVWFGNVEVAVAKRIGRETVHYVSNIYKYYIAYQLVVPKMLARQEIRSDDGLLTGDTLE